MKRIWTFKYCLAGTTALLTFAIYLNALGNGFVNWDDNLNVYENRYIRSLDSAFLKWAFFDFSAPGADYWRPLSFLSHALDYAIWGLNPMGHHLTNNILHAANTFLVVLLAARLIESANPVSPIPGFQSRLTSHSSRFTLVAAGVTGLLFGLHPLHVESVAWISERKDLLCAFFFLLSIMAYVKYACAILLHGAKGLWHREKDDIQSAELKEQRVVSSIFPALGFFTLALLSKPMAVTLPVVLLILDWYPLQRLHSLKTFWPVFIEKIPFFALSLASSILLVLDLKATESLSVELVPLSSRVGVAAKAVIAYLGKIVFPVKLLPFYPYPQDVSLFSLKYLSAIILISLITVVCVVMAKKHKLLLSAWGYYVITLIPVLGLVQVGSQSMADRYTYLPGLGPFIIIGMAAALGWEKMNTALKGEMFVRLCSTAVALCLLISMSTLTVKQIAIWKNNLTLWSYVIEKDPIGVPHAYNNLGITYKDIGQLNKALENYNKAIALNPLFYKAYTNRGIVLEKMGQLDKALENYNKSIALNPSYYVAYTNRGIFFKKAEQYDKALEDYNKAIALNPFYYVAYNNRAIVFRKIMQFDKALENYNKAIALNPFYFEAYFNRGIAFKNAGRFDKALEDFKKACELGYTDACRALQN